MPKVIQSQAHLSLSALRLGVDMYPRGIANIVHQVAIFPQLAVGSRQPGIRWWCLWLEIPAVSAWSEAPLSNCCSQGETDALTKAVAFQRRMSSVCVSKHRIRLSPVLFETDEPDDLSVIS